MLQGSPAIAIALTFNEVTPPAVVDVLIYFTASSLLVAHVFAFNDWADIGSDLKDPIKAPATFVQAGLSPRGVALLSLGLGLTSLILFSLLSFWTLTLAFGVISCGLIYSDATVRAKEVLILSSVVHIIGGLLHFLSGYSVFGIIDQRAILIGVYFALVFAAGHLTQEVRDYDGDLDAGTLTHAVWFGKRRTLIASLVLFSASYAYIFSLVYVGLLADFFLVALAVYPIQVFMFWRILRNDVTFETVSRFQLRYRLLFSLIGLAMLANLLNRLVTAL